MGKPSVVVDKIRKDLKAHRSASAAIVAAIETKSDAPRVMVMAQGHEAVIYGPNDQQMGVQNLLEIRITALLDT